MINDSVKALRLDIIKFMGAKRYMHTLGVERAALKIGAHFMLDTVSLSTAALLHDIAKEMDTDTQIALIKESGVLFLNEDIKTPSVLHSLASVGAIQKYFKSFADDTVLSATYSHTAGKAGMSIFDAVIFIADFVEDGREYTVCQQMAKSLYSALADAEKPEEKKEVLKEYLLKIIDFTIEYLDKKSLTVNSRLIVAKNDVILKNLQD